jgi:hypothetical protein
MSKRIHRRRPKRGGFNPLAVHSALQAVKPITTGIKIAEALGVKDRIDRALSSNPVGHAVKSVGNFIQNTLGYGSKRPRRRYGIGRHRRPGRPRIHRVRGGSKRRIHRRRGRGELMVI